MSIRPFLLAACVAAGCATSALAQSSPPATTIQTAPMSSDMFYRETQTPAHWRASESMGMAVYNRAGERIGEIDDLLIDGSGRVNAAVVGVGGFLGMGERKVAISYRSFEMTRESDGTPRLLVDLTKDVLKTAPEYKMAPMKRS
jgi:sporulation protein YlmC with PRC-barrel domain